MFIKETFGNREMRKNIPQHILFHQPLTIAIKTLIYFPSVFDSMYKTLILTSLLYCECNFISFIFT